MRLRQLLRERARKNRVAIWVAITRAKHIHYPFSSLPDGLETMSLLLTRTFQFQPLSEPLSIYPAAVFKSSI